jgi:hypothetical protein
MAISYEWRGEFTSALHAECVGHPVLGDDDWDWRGQVEGHSPGWCAREGAGLVGFVNVACAASTSTPAGSPRPTPA